MKTLVLVFTAVLISTPAFAESFLKCNPSSESLENAKNSDMLYKYSASPTSDGRLRGEMTVVRKDQMNNSIPKLKISNLLNFGVRIIDGTCRAKFSFYRDDMDFDCQNVPDDCDKYRPAEMVLTLDMGSKLESGEFEADIFYKMPQKSYLFGAVKSAPVIDAKVRGMKCSLDSAHIESLCDGFNKPYTNKQTNTAALK